MANLKREFLYNDSNKFIPVQLTRIVSAAANILDDIQSDIEQENVIPLDINFPSQSSCMAFLIQKGEEDRIVDVQIAPPGTEEIEFSLRVGESYNVYVVSKEYDDGYINNERVVEGDITNNRWEITIEEDTPDISLDLTLSGRMTLSVDDEDSDQWYNYGGSYQRDGLIWEYPPSIQGEMSDSSSNLLIARDVLSFFKRMFDKYNLDTFSQANKQDVVNVFYVMSSIAEFMNAYRESLPSELDTYWNFLDNNFIEDDQGRAGAQYMDEDFYNTIAGTAALADYMFYDGDGWTQGFDYGVYIDANARVNNPQEFNAYIPQFDDDNNIVGYLDGVTIDETPSENPATQAAGAHIRDYILTKHGEYGGQLEEYNISIFERTENGVDTWWTSIGNISSEYWNNVYEWLIDEIQNIDTTLEQLGDAAFSDGDGGEASNYPLAHEATLQNIRFVKNLINSVNENVWSSVNGVNSVLVREVGNIRRQVSVEGRMYSILNSTNAIVDGSNIRILYSKIQSNGITSWQEVPTEFTSLENGVILVNLNGPQFRTLGKYMISIQPRGFSFDDGIRVSSEPDTYGQEYLVLAQSDILDQYPGTNIFQGWNLQLKDSTGNNLGKQKIITQSLYRENGYILRVHPFETFSQAGKRVVMWSNEFEPVMIDLDIVEHNNLTLSYGMYARREMNRDTGLVTLYDYNGNVYKQLSYGQYSNANTGGAIIEYRDPTPTSGSNG